MVSRLLGRLVDCPCPGCVAGRRVVGRRAMSEETVRIPVYRVRTPEELAALRAMVTEAQLRIERDFLCGGNGGNGGGGGNNGGDVATVVTVGGGGGGGRDYGFAEYYDAARAAAYDKARRLLLEWLSPEQRAQFEKNGTFDVIGSATAHRYRISQDPTYNVEDVSAGSATHREVLCVVSIEPCPIFDTMLAQKIMIENDERAFLAIANLSRALRRPAYYDMPQGYSANLLSTELPSE